MIAEPWAGWLAWGVLFLAILAAVLIVWSILERRGTRRRYDMGTQEPGGYFVKVYHPGSLLPTMMDREVSKSEAEFVVAMFAGSLIDGEDFP